MLPNGTAVGKKNIYELYMKNVFSLLRNPPRPARTFGHVATSCRHILLFVTRSKLLIVVTSTINRGLKIPGVWWPERVLPGLIHRRALRRFATRAFLGGAILRSASNFLTLRICTSYRVPYAWSGKLSRTASEQVQRLSALARHGLRSTLCPCKKT